LLYLRVGGRQVTDVLCEVCGADRPEEFMTEEDYEGMISGEAG